MTSTETPHPGRPTLLEPLSRALDWTGQVLFRPFDIKKWFVLGFCAWLSQLGQGGGGSSNWNLSGDEARYKVERAHDWALAHLGLVIFIAVTLVVLGIVLILLFTWLSSRGKFMFVDGVVRDRGAVVEPWHRFRQLGNSLFFFRVVFGICAFIVIGATVGMMALSLFALGIDERDPGAGVLAFIILWILVIMALAFAVALVALAVHDFVVPIMWVRGSRVMDAWSEFLTLLSGRPGVFFLYVLLRFLVAVVVIAISCIVVCVTCCVAAIPYIGTVLLLPLHVFHRSFSLYFLSQFGPDYAPLGPVKQPPPGPPAVAAAGAAG